MIYSLKLYFFITFLVLAFIILITRGTHFLPSRQSAYFFPFPLPLDCAWKSPKEITWQLGPKEITWRTGERKSPNEVTILWSRQKEVKERERSSYEFFPLHKIAMTIRRVWLLRYQKSIIWLRNSGHHGISSEYCVWTVNGR